LAPLTLVEVEFASLEAAGSFTAPDWFGTEVTADARFKNKALAMMDTWQEPQ
jgi:adenylate cyclase